MTFDMKAARSTPARFLAVVLVLGTALGGAACARPFRGPKTLGAIGTALLVAGGTTWVVGERSDRDAMITSGVIGTAVGIVAVIAAGGFLAASAACRADPDCPEGEECREIPAPPGRILYKQCMRRE